MTDTTDNIEQICAVNFGLRAQLHGIRNHLNQIKQQLNDAEARVRSGDTTGFHEEHLDREITLLEIEGQLDDIERFTKDAS
jgi:hypothetical protein